ncbi:hypothetical protein H2198_007391 [Neophaeococcomyces mojaviensis]|uniref:Uncharacterized protein n=1 Tax=Neophaeococcomyces mojaviensis TaxID=3383035 RepID=A0ACC3A0W2_9EURO|nr:hypothetical protein H2198_007391 [Knufia sp. JES_112]
MGATHSKTTSYVLETKKGKLRGIEQKDANGKPILYRYAKIPYARPPVGDLRWRRPQPLSSDFSFSTASGEPGDYSQFGPICPQPEYGHGAAVLENPDAAPKIENTQSEDCLYLNIWVPASSPPPSGWPVQFHIHGGWLQVGDANQSNDHDPFDIFANGHPRIIAVPTYRLNLFGFLAGSDLASAEPADPAPGNYGLWDQRMALEWVQQNIAFFGGNPNMITVGGLSAGAHSAFLQLYYDTYLSDSQRIIKQVYLWSNAIAIQPNPLTSQILTDQFISLCEALSIDASSNSSSKSRLVALRQVPADQLVTAISKLKMHTFRTSTDNSFLSNKFLRTLHDGSFTALLAKHKIRVILGEVCDEALLYKLVNPPSTHTDLVRQFGNYYPKPVVDKLVTLTDVYDIPDPAKDDASSQETKERYQDVFARIVADMQVHASLRGLTKCLAADTGSGTPEVLRYRISWRAKELDHWIAPEVGVCHAADTPIWWMSGWRGGYDEEDKQKALKFLKPFADLFEGKSLGVTTAMPHRIARYMDQNGQTHENVEDDLWEKAMRVWDAVAEAGGKTNQSDEMRGLKL